MKTALSALPHCLLLSTLDFLFVRFLLLAARALLAFVSRCAVHLKLNQTIAVEGSA
jgi:hypothetical protein